MEAVESAKNASLGHGEEQDKAFGGEGVSIPHAVEKPQEDPLESLGEEHIEDEDAEVVFKVRKK